MTDTKTLVDEVNDLLNNYKEEPKEEVSDDVKSGSDETTEEESVAEESGVEDETEEETDEEEVETSEESEEEESEPSELNKLRVELDALKLEFSKKESKVETPKADPIEEWIKKDLSDDVDFLTGTDIEDDSFIDKSTLNKLLNKVRKMSYTEVRNSLGEDILRKLPDINRAQIESVYEMLQLRNKFYSENSDLLPHKTTVADLCAEVETENPSLSMEDQLKIVATKTRERLNLKKQVLTNSKPNPRLPGGSHGGARKTQIIRPKKTISDALEKMADL